VKDCFAEGKGVFPGSTDSRWEEPFGVALIDALASGTPVVAYRRGAFLKSSNTAKQLFLADTEAEFKRYMKRIGEIDPEECRPVQLNANFSQKPWLTNT